MNNLDKYLLDRHSDAENDYSPEPNRDEFKTAALEFEAESNNSDFDLLVAQLIESGTIVKLVESIIKKDMEQSAKWLSDLDRLSEANMAELITRRINSIDLMEANNE